MFPLRLVDLLAASVCVLLLLVGRSHCSGEAPPSKSRKLTFKDLEFGESIPQRIAALDGTTVQIRGYVHGASVPKPTFTQFILVRDSHAFAPWPICNNVAVELASGNIGQFTTRPVTVTGTFRVTKPRVAPRGNLTTVYRLDDARLERPPK